jgi:hypothetical protein
MQVGLQSDNHALNRCKKDVGLKPELQDKGQAGLCGSDFSPTELS